MNPNFRRHLLEITKSTSCGELEVIQSLWSGYGQISRYRLEGSSIDTVIIKHINLGPANDHPRGWNTDIGHQRKVRSYEVETDWYERWNKRCSDACRTAKFLGSYSADKEQWIILEDLDAEFPLRKQYLSLSEVKACLSWLASFHGTFINRKPDGLWNVGTYWHLETRPEEFEKIENTALKEHAHLIDEILNNCEFQTIVHGDAKVANFCFSDVDAKVAAVDFQYVGGGCGMKDVAYFLGSCLTSQECETYADELLDHYFSELRKVVANSQPVLDFAVLEQEWRSMYPIAWTDFTRFLLGWMPDHQKVNGYSLRLMEAVLGNL